MPNLNEFFSRTTFDKDITPYIHVFIYHVHYFVHRYGCLKVFEMEAVEQLNYVNKLVFFGSSNHGKDKFTVTKQVLFLPWHYIIQNLQFFNFNIPNLFI